MIPCQFTQLDLTSLLQLITHHWRAAKSKEEKKENIRILLHLLVKKKQKKNHLNYWSMIELAFTAVRVIFQLVKKKSSSLGIHNMKNVNI